MQPVAPERGEEALAHGRRHPFSRQVVNPDPGERAERHLEGAGPVDAALERVRLHPAFPLRKGVVQKLRPARQPPRLREQNQVLMPIDLPDDLVVARARGIEVRNAAEVGGSGLDAAGVIAPPADVPPGLYVEAEQRETAPQNVPGDALDVGRVGGPPQPPHHRFRIGKRGQRRHCIQPGLGRAKQEPSVHGFLRQPEADLGKTAHVTPQGRVHRTRV